MDERKGHNYWTQKYWGHDIATLTVDGLNIEVGGFGKGIKIGDFIILKGPSGGPSAYLITKIRYCLDPRDMFFLSAVYCDSTQKEMSGSADDLIIKVKVIGILPKTSVDTESEKEI